MNYLVEVTTYNDGTKDAYGLYPFEDYNEAVSRFHTKMGGAMKKGSNIKTEMCAIVDESGITLRNEYYIAIVPAPDPVPEEETESVEEV